MLLWIGRSEAPKCLDERRIAVNVKIELVEISKMKGIKKRLEFKNLSINRLEIYWAFSFLELKKYSSLVSDIFYNLIMCSVLFFKGLFFREIISMGFGVGFGKKKRSRHVGYWNYFKRFVGEFAFLLQVRMKPYVADRETYTEGDYDWLPRLKMQQAGAHV